MGQRYRVVAVKGWVPDSVYGARLVVIAPIGGAGHSPEADDVLELTGEKHDARSELGVPAGGYRAPGDEPEAKPGDPPPHAGHDSNHPH